MTAVVFVGPSLDVESAARELEVEFLPSVRRGDIDALLARDARPIAIGIIDGVFLHSLCISPKEVLRALDAGVTVFGASSMGALRAVECAPYGMLGVGRIYAEYASGRVDGDDEVAIGFDTDSGRALSEPLINWRLALAVDLTANLISPDLADRFLALAKGIYFPHRTVETVLQLLAAEVGWEQCARLANYLANEAPDVKRDDAITLLQEMRRFLDEREILESCAAGARNPGRR